MSSIDTLSPQQSCLGEASERDHFSAPMVASSRKSNRRVCLADTSSQGLKRFQHLGAVVATRPRGGTTAAHTNTTAAPRCVGHGSARVSQLAVTSSTGTDAEGSSVGALLSSSEAGKPLLTPMYHTSGRPGHTLAKVLQNHAARAAAQSTQQAQPPPSHDAAPPRAMPRVIDCTQYLNNPDAAPDRGPHIAALRRQAMMRYAAMKGLPLPPNLPPHGTNA